MINISQLEYLLAVETHRHFGKAAKACHVTQPTLSMQIQKLEEELGVVIFDRSKKPILATEAGEALLRQARLVVSEFKKLHVMAKHQEGVVAGDFHLAIIPTLSTYVIPLVLESFANAYPEVKLHIREMQTDHMIDALEREEVDGGILATPLGVSGIKEDVLFYEPFYLYVHREHALAKKKQVRESDVDGKELWLLEEGHCFRNQVARFCGMRGKKSVLPNVRFESGSLETLKRLVERHMGYTLVPYLAVMTEMPEDSDAVVIPFTKPVPSREVSLVYRREQLKQPILHALKDTILKALPSKLTAVDKRELEVLDI